MVTFTLLLHQLNNINNCSPRSRNEHRTKSRSHRPVKDKDWVQKKKELRRKRGLEVAADSKYTARKRKGRF